MNAGAGLYIGGKVDSLQAGIDLAAKLIDSGKANEKLEEFIKEFKQNRSVYYDFRRYC